MAWSTRELAELADTTLRTVRHYHDTGLMADPPRDVNGYKRYGVGDLVRLLRIRRLVDLGFTLPQIRAMSDVEDRPSEDLERLEQQLAERIERLQRIRSELSAVLERGGRDPLLGARLPGPAQASLTEADRDFLVVLARVASPEVLVAYLDMVRDTHRDPVLAELDALADDADEESRDDLAERLAEHTRSVHRAYPVLLDTAAGSGLGRGVALEVMRAAAAELYTPAQLDVVRRAAALGEGDAAG